MNTTECLKLLAVIAATYPNSGAAKASDDVLKMTAQAWAAALSDIPYNIASNAMIGIIKTQRFAPTPADIRSACSIVTGQSTTRTADDMAALFFKARGYGFHNWERIFQQKGIELTEDERNFFAVQLFIAKEEDATRAASGQSENVDVVRGQIVRAWEQHKERAKTETAYAPIAARLAEKMQGRLTD